MTNATRRELINKAKAINYPGSYTELFSAADRGEDLLEQFSKQQLQAQQQKFEQPAPQQSMQQSQVPNAAGFQQPSQGPDRLVNSAEESEAELVNVSSGSHNGRIIGAAESPTSAYLKGGLRAKVVYNKPGYKK